MIELIIVVVVFFLVWFLCRLLSNPESKLYVLDEPTSRSLHLMPKPRVGGIAIFSVIFISFIVILFLLDDIFLYFWFLLGMLLIALVSFLDDRSSLPHLIRLVIHIIAGLMFLVVGINAESIILNLEVIVFAEYILNILLVLIIVWIINLYNFMDGMDGLAGGMAVIGFACLGFLAWMSNNYVYMLMAWVVSAANCGFLFHNFPPAKIFMGDLGSITNGYLVAFFSFWGIGLDVLQWWGPILIFSPFIVDATITLLSRILSREVIWQPHKSHYYQRLVDSGWGHSKTVLFEYLLMILAALTTIILHLEKSTLLMTIALSSWVIFYLIILYSINQFCRNEEKYN